MTEAVPHILLVLPTVQLSHLASDPHLVLVPEILYKITVAKDVGMRLLGSYKLLIEEKYGSEESVFAQVIRGISSGGLISQKALEDIEELKGVFLNRKNHIIHKEGGNYHDNSVVMSDKEPWLLLGVLSRDGNMSTVCRITNISNASSGSSTMTMFFKALARGVVNGKAVDRGVVNAQENNGEYMEMETDVYFNDLFVTNVATESALAMTNDQLYWVFTTFVSETNLMFHNIASFKNIYKDNLSSAYKLLVRLSPVASVLFALLEKDRALEKVQKIYRQVFEEIRMKKSAEALELDVGNKHHVLRDSGSSMLSLFARDKSHSVVSSKENHTKVFVLVSILRLYDLIVSLLPISADRKYQFLSCVDWPTRVTKEGPAILSSFNSVLLSFLDNYDFIMKDFVKGADDKDKLKLVVNHLTTLKQLMENINKKAPKTVQKNDVEDEEPDESMRKLRRFYKLLTAKDSPIDVSFDGKKLIKKDFERLFKMTKSPMAKNSSEYQVLINYLEIVMDLPWSVDESANKLVDLKTAEKQLDDDHYGLRNVKNRLVEYLGVLNLYYKVEQYKQESKKQNDIVLSTQTACTARKNKFNVAKSPILCLAGPPGVGKTSLAKSVATALGRKFQRISLGGISDEAEIRGHRRTYVGAMPGVVVSALRKAKTLNPVILLDEIDKISSNAASRGDPSAAMLEVLDPEQNSSFNDHYLGFPIDLSQVLFFCTANDLSRMHPALMDRMEVIHLSGYNYLDKIKIVENHLLPKQLTKNSLPHNAVKLDPNCILKIVTEYTHSEAGIRNLERQISTLCRNKALELSNQISRFTKETVLGSVLPENYSPIVTEEDLPTYLGIPTSYQAMQQNQIVHSKFSERFGIVNGLSYNSDGTGGTLLFETVAIPSTDKKPSFTMTGKLGDVLTESARIAISLVQLILSKNLLFVNPDPNSVSCYKALETLQTHQIHLHAPEGAISKDGPSAGITITLALLSLLLQKPVDSHIAMTGEMTLRGVVLPIGGVKEKLLGAHLSKKIHTVILPRSNRRDIIEDYISSSAHLEELKSNGDPLELRQDTTLLQVLKTEQENIHNCDIYDKPEEYVEKSLGIRIHYVEDFWDVIRVVWNNQVSTKAFVDDITARL